MKSMEQKLNEKNTIITIIALLVSLFVQMQSISLLGITIPLSLSEGKSSINTIGQIMALYSIGLVIGSYHGKKIIASVGHIRAFAGFAAVATSAAIVHSLTYSELTYGILRIISGISAATMLIVIESWFNTLSQNSNRGRLLATHQVIYYFAMGSGQLLINVFPNNYNSTFLVAALLSCFALIPLTLVRIENPKIALSTPIKLSKLFKIVPAGIIGAICAGNCIGTLFNLAPIYAKNIGSSTIEISVFMSAIIFSGVLLQKTIGHLTDKHSRTNILVIMLFITAACMLLIPMLSSTLPLSFLGILIGPPIACLYPISVGIVYEKLSADKAVASSSALMLAYAIGGFSGPVLASYAMTYLGNNTLFIFVAIYCFLGAILSYFAKRFS